MKIDWRISDDDVKKVTDFVNQQSNTHVANRIARNLEHQGLLLNRDKVLDALLFSLLYPDQRTGIHSKIISIFQINIPHLQYDVVLNAPDKKELVFEFLKQNGIIQNINKAPDYFANNFSLLESTNWDLLNILKETFLKKDSKHAERSMVDKIDTMFKGFGTVEACLFLQYLGLTKYEIPIDIVVADWFNNFGFPVVISTMALHDRNYYHFITDGIQLLCEKANVYPCVLEAAIHAVLLKK